MIYVLVLLVSTSGASPSVTTQEFNSESACESASDIIRLNFNGTWHTQSFCVSKG